MLDHYHNKIMKEKEYSIKFRKFILIKMINNLQHFSHKDFVDLGVDEIISWKLYNSIRTKKYSGMMSNNLLLKLLPVLAFYNEE